MPFWRNGRGGGGEGVGVPEPATPHLRATARRGAACCAAPPGVARRVQARPLRTGCAQQPRLEARVLHRLRQLLGRHHRGVKHHLGAAGQRATRRGAGRHRSSAGDARRGAGPCPAGARGWGHSDDLLPGPSACARGPPSRSAAPTSASPCASATPARSTPATAASACSTAPLHAAQVIPPTASRATWGAATPAAAGAPPRAGPDSSSSSPSKPASSTAVTRASGRVTAGSKRTFGRGSGVAGARCRRCGVRARKAPRARGEVRPLLL